MAMPYSSKLSLLETQKAIETVKVVFGDAVCEKLNLTRVSAPLFVETDSGLNDDLGGWERAVTFDLRSGKSASVVHSLSKWKRMALKKYEFGVHSGLYVDMNAIRREEEADPTHSYYVDQYEWEMVIEEKDRNISFLETVARDVYECLKKTEERIVREHPASLRKKLPEEMTCVSSQQMEDAYPVLSPKERETKFCREYGAVFVTQVGKRMRSGERHGGRAPDADDWELNGDIVVHYDDRALELSSMGIRVTRDSLVRQLAAEGVLERLRFPFHKALANGELPFTYGGGVGQSRLCMFLLDKIHIGEVQASVWSDSVVQQCKARNIMLL